MNRCPHSVYDPTGTGISPYCSGCTTPQVGTISSAGTIPFNPFPGGEKRCPRCGERKGFKFKSEYEWNCRACDADALDPND